MRSRAPAAALLALTVTTGCRSPEPTTAPAAEPSAEARDQPGSEQARRNQRNAELRERWACAPDSADYRTARDELRSLDTAIRALADLDDPTLLLARIAALLKNPCMGLSRIHAVPRPAQSGLALKLWWERGGVRWLAASLRFANGKIPAGIVIPPTMPSTLSAQTHAGHPLAPLLCGLHDDACSAATAGWEERAQQVMGRNWEIRYVIDQADDFRRCEKAAAEWEYSDQYEYWAHCMFRAEGDNSEFPLGGLRAPAEGWLVLEGRRGHYSFCDELHAYELKTGSAHVVRSCSGLEFNEEDASIDEEAVDDGRKLVAERGMVPADNVRELAWMLLIADHVVSPSVPEVVGLELPETIEAPASRQEIGISNVGLASGSNQTTIHWSLSTPALGTLEGEFDWPPGYNAAPLRHAAKLWSVVEKGVAPSCPTLAVPEALPGAPTLGGVSPIDASADSLDQAHRALHGHLRGSAPGCTPS